MLLVRFPAAVYIARVAAVMVVLACHTGPPSPADGGIDCRSAERTIESAPSVDHNDPAGRVIAWCGHDGAKAIAARVSRLRTSTDSAELARTSEIAWGLRDGAIFSAALAVFADTTASELARIHAVEILHSQLYPDSDISWRGLVGDGSGAGGTCAGTSIVDSGQRTGARLPFRAGAKAARAARAVRDDPRSPAKLSSAAQCIAFY